MDNRTPFVNVFPVAHPLWAIADDIQGNSSVARIEAIQTVTFVDDIGNIEIETYYFMPTSTDRPDWVFEDDVEGPFDSEEGAKARMGEMGSEPEEKDGKNPFK
jgi:hypothetical protein